MTDDVDIEWRAGQFTALQLTYEAAKEYGFGYGCDFSIITKADIEILLAGKMLAFSDGEYSHFIKLEDS